MRINTNFYDAVQDKSASQTRQRCILFPLSSGSHIFSIFNRSLGGSSSLSNRISIEEGSKKNRRRVRATPKVGEKRRCGGGMEGEKVFNGIMCYGLLCCVSFNIKRELLFLFIFIIRNIFVIFAISTLCVI